MVSSFFIYSYGGKTRIGEKTNGEKTNGEKTNGENQS